MTLFFSLVSFIFVMSITPGPNNIMLWASGANYGFRATIPHMLGIWLGFASLLLCCGLGLGAIFTAFPVFQLVLKVIGSVYLTYLAYRIAKASFEADVEKRKPFSFWEAAGFQYANPKAWVFTITVMSSYRFVELTVLENIALIVISSMIVNAPCLSAWTLFGTAIGRFLQDNRIRITFNLTMSLLLLLTIVLLYL